MTLETPAREGQYGHRIGSPGGAVAFSSQEDDATRPRFLGQVYSLVGFPGQEFPEFWIRRIRETYDPGFRPIMRRMVYRTAAGAEYYRENWGVARFSTKRPAPPWEQILLRAAPNATSGYLSTLERPNLIDMWWPIQGLEADGHTPPFEPFNGPLLYRWFEQIVRARQACRDITPLELLERLVAQDNEREEREFEQDLDARARDAVDNFPKFSTTNVAPTQRHHQIQEIPA